MHRRLPLLIALLSALVIDIHDARAADWAINVGAIEAIGVPGGAHLGLYPYLGISVAKTWGKVTLIPGLAVEAAPENGHWGLVGTLVADFSVARYVGIDVQIVAITDQPGLDFGGFDLLLGAGTGISLFLGEWTISPFVNFFRDIFVPGWVLVPGLNLAHAL